MSQLKKKTLTLETKALEEIQPFLDEDCQKLSQLVRILMREYIKKRKKDV